MVIKILGTGCPKCKKTEEVVTKAVNELNITATIEKVEDIQDIMAYDVMNTPAVVIDEKVVWSGRVPNIFDVKILLQSQ
ncbi:MAG: redox-active disulfide protein 2 [Flavobacteriia bacterium]|nr:MAG: redox-active disulfide protein 2 [Flavobacteriia bacterium]